MWIFQCMHDHYFGKTKQTLKLFIQFEKKVHTCIYVPRKNIESLGFSAKIIYWVVEKLKIKMNNLIIYCDIGDFLMILYN